jgi:hypothetical protein
MSSYDDWKLASGYDEWDGEQEEGCSCPRTLGAGGTRRTDKWCPLHGLDPDAEYERQRDDRP